MQAKDRWEMERHLGTITDWHTRVKLEEREWVRLTQGWTAMSMPKLAPVCTKQLSKAIHLMMLGLNSLLCYTHHWDPLHWLAQRLSGSVSLGKNFLFPAECRAFPSGTNSKDPTCQCRRYNRCGFEPWVDKIACRRAWQSTPVFSPGESPWTEEPGGLQSLGSQSQTRLSNFHFHFTQVT